MQPRHFLRTSVAVLGLGLLASCGALTSLDQAAAPQDSFELTPLPAGTIKARNTGLSLEVAMPTATGSFTDDHIVVKPNAVQVQALPDARWVNETTDLVQFLLARSVAGTGRYSLVSVEGEGPVPDLVLLTDLQAFQAEVTEDGARVVVRMTMNLVRGNGDVIASRNFENIVPLDDITPMEVVQSLDRATSAQLEDIVRWLVGRGV